MDLGQGLGYCHCASVIDIIRGGGRKIELAPWVKTLLREEWQYTCHNAPVTGSWPPPLLPQVSGLLPSL
jgi:hypothetical protein